MAQLNKKEVDVVVVGWLGWLADEHRAGDGGINGTGVRKGPERDYAEFAYPKPADEYAYAVRNKVMTTPAESAVTVRYNMDQTALPTRKWGAFVPGGGVGGSGLHWTGVLIRPTPTDLKLKTYADRAYKPGILAEEMRIMDFPFTG